MGCPVEIIAKAAGLLHFRDKRACQYGNVYFVKGYFQVLFYGRSWPFSLEQIVRSIQLHEPPSYALCDCL